MSEETEVPTTDGSWPDTFEVIVGVDKHGEGFLLNWPSFIEDWLENGSDPRDNGFSNLPKEPGVHRCTVDWHYGRNDDPEFPITESVKVLDPL